MFHKLTINSIAARAVLVPMARRLRTAAGDVPAAPLVLVDVQTNEGIVGRSYAFAYTPVLLRTLVQFLRDVAPALVGQSVSPRERMRQLDAQLKLMGMQGVVGMAIGALDQALWDALGRAADLPVAEYLDLAGAVLTEPLLPDKGKIVARGPGLGHEWDEKAVDKYAFQ